jgi:DNA-directed RNA polymerase subunit RPC12/RpoP
MIRCKECGKKLLIKRINVSRIVHKDIFNVEQRKDGSYRFTNIDHHTIDSEIENQEYTCYLCGTMELDEEMMDAMWDSGE